MGTKEKLQMRRIGVQMKAIRLATRYLEQQGASGNSTWQQLANEQSRLRNDLSSLEEKK